jgi:hypothetical protein
MTVTLERMGSGDLSSAPESAAPVALTDAAALVLTQLGIEAPNADQAGSPPAQASVDASPFNSTYI